MSLNDILEWQAIVALRGYLNCTLPVVDEGFDPSALNEADISSGNARDNFEFELTRIFVRPDPPFQIGDAKVDNCRSKLVKLVTLLDSLAGVHRLPPGQGRDLRFQHIFGSTNYKRLWALLEHLEATKVELNLIKGGAQGPAFDVPRSDIDAGHLKTVQDVNFLFDSLPLSQKGTAAPKDSTPDVAAAGILGDSVRGYATAAFNTMFGQLRDCTPAHRAMLYLRSQKDDSLKPPKASLDLFVSLCPNHCGWQEIQCGERENLELGPRKVKNLCQFIKAAKKQRQGIMMHVVGEEIQDITQALPCTRHPRDSPSKSLHSLISRNVFKPLDLDHMVSDRFTRTEKRRLAMDIASSLSRLLGSDWVGKGWCSKDLFFLGTKIDQARSNTPFGPYITCSAGGPPLADLERWRQNLDDPPILLFLAKLLLEIDLGKDLDGRIEEALKEDPEDNLGLLLSEIHEQYQHDLDYSDAIVSCLKYHKTRQVKLQLREITEAPGQWSEWDRRYIQGVIKQLTDPATEAPGPEPRHVKERQQGGGWMGHMRHSGSKARPPPVNLSEVSPRAMSDQSSDPGLTASMESIASFSPSRPDSTYATMVNLEQRATSPLKDPTAEACRPMPADGRETKPDAVPQMPQPAGNISLRIRGWLDSADQSVAAPRDPSALRLTPEPRMMEGDEVGVFFDATESPTLLEHQKEVKIALIDTGVDVEDPFIKPEAESGRIKGRSWVGEKTDFSDSCGHGTHLVRLVLKVNKTADILMAKVSDSKSFSPKNTQNIAEWTVKQDADIISLSLGFKQEVKLIGDALDEIINPKDKNMDARPRLVFAAAANWGFNRSLAFPASKKGVICVHATSGNGCDGKLSPKSDKSMKNFSIGTLGVAIESEWGGKPVWLKGTSYATPIAAAVAANVLEFARQNLDAQMQSELKKFRGMKAVLALMCEDCNSSSYEYCAPWVIYGKVVNRVKVYTTAQIREAIVHEVDELNY
ncbi:hypothetical protein RB595_003681 [Gaeumannomyces hyphopodioides]